MIQEKTEILKVHIGQPGQVGQYSYGLGHAIAQAVCHWLSTAVAWV
jgi:hypothetical protein